MKYTEITQIFQLISSYSNKIRQIYTGYGFSNQEINKRFQILICVDEEIDMLVSKEDKLQSTQNQQNEENRIRSFQEIVISQMKVHKNDIALYLSKVLGKLEIQIVELEEFKKLGQSIINQSLQTSHPELQRKDSVEIVVTNASRDSIVEESDKKSNISSTEADSHITQHQAQLENSLQALIYKTKLLRAILQKQMFSASIMQLRGRPNYCINTLNSFLVE